MTRHVTTLTASGATRRLATHISAFVLTVFDILFYLCTFYEFLFSIIYFLPRVQLLHLRYLLVAYSDVLYVCITFLANEFIDVYFILLCIADKFVFLIVIVKLGRLVQLKVTYSLYPLALSFIAFLQITH